MIRGTLLDIDGTLLDSSDAHAASFADALAEQGRQVSPTQLKSLIGMGGDKLLPTLGIDPSSKLPRVSWRRRASEPRGARSRRPPAPPR